MDGYPRQIHSHRFALPTSILNPFIWAGELLMVRTTGCYGWIQHVRKAQKGPEIDNHRRNFNCSWKLLHDKDLEPVSESVIKAL